MDFVFTLHAVECKNQYLLNKWLVGGSRVKLNDYSPSADFLTREESGGQDLDSYQDWSPGSGSIIISDPDPYQ